MKTYDIEMTVPIKVIAIGKDKQEAIMNAISSMAYEYNVPYDRIEVLSAKENKDNG